MKKSIYLLLPILVLSIFFGYKYLFYDIPILSYSISSVEHMRIYKVKAVSPKYEEIVYLDTTNKNEIEKFYDSIANTKCNIRERDKKGDINEAEPKFVIEISYDNGAVDVINSSGDGTSLYRELKNKRSEKLIVGENLEINKWLFQP